MIVDYAPVPHRSWPRRLRRYLSLGGALVLVGLAVYWRKPVLEQARCLYLQRQCMEWNLPAGTVVLDDDPDAFTVEMRAGAAYVVQRRHDRFGNGYGFAVRDHAAARQFGFLTPWGPSQTDAFGAAFMHRRRSPCGNERLLVVLGHGTWGALSDNAPSMSIEICLWKPATWQLGSKPALVRQSFGFPDPAYSAPLANVANLTRSWRHKVFAGQVDPDDPSHFTLSFKEREWLPVGPPDGPTGTFDFWLRDDDNVDIRLRPGPYAMHLNNLVKDCSWPGWKEWRKQHGLPPLPEAD